MVGCVGLCGGLWGDRGIWAGGLRGALGGSGGDCGSGGLWRVGRGVLYWGWKGANMAGLGVTLSWLGVANRAQQPARMRHIGHVSF